MKLHEKIRSIRKDKGLKLTDVCHRIEEHFGPRKIHYRTLQRIEAGETEPTEFSLYRICFALQIKLSDLLEENESIAKFIPKNKPQGRFEYLNTTSYATKLSTRKLKGILPQKLFLSAGDRLPMEKDIDESGEKIYEKWIYGLKGETTCIVNGKKYTLNKNDVLFFEAHHPHNFENNSSKSAVCLIIYCPPYP